MAQITGQTTTESLDSPVVWKTTQATANQLLGKQGRPLLDKVIDQAKEVAGKRKWPLKRIKVEYYEDPEIAGWHYLIMVLVFLAPPAQAYQLYREFLDDVAGLQYSLGPRQQLTFSRKISYDFEIA